MCCIIGETVPSDVCPFINNKILTNTFVVISLYAVLLVSVLVVGLVRQREKYIKSMTDNKQGTNPSPLLGDDQRAHLQDQDSMPMVVISSSHTDQLQFSIPVVKI